MADSVSADPRIGTEIAGYRTERLLGRGGMSVVYLAEQVALKREVADSALVLNERPNLRDRSAILHLPR